MHYVYAHYTSDTNELFYIGKGSKNRAWSTKRNKYWKRIVKKHGLNVQILLRTEDPEYAYLQESLAIAEFRPKANFLHYGRVLKTAVYLRTPEHIAYMKIRTKGVKHQWLSGKHPWVGKKHSEHTKKLNSLSRQKYKLFDVFDSNDVLVGQFSSRRDAAFALKLPHPSNISACLAGVAKSYKGYKFTLRSV